MAGQAQEPVTFEDVAVFLSRDEWDALVAAQRELYCDVMADTYELLSSLGYPGPKPDILHRLERGEEPWICSSSPGHAGSWLEEPSSDWWPRASGHQGLETSCPAAGSTLWCPQDRKFLKKSGCHEGRSAFPSEAGSGVGSQTQPWLVKEEVEEKPAVTENLTQSSTFLPHSVTEQQSLDPWEQLWADPGERNPANTHGHSSGEAALLPGTWEPTLEELQVAVAKDHSYCLRSEPGTPRVPWPRSRWEHNYSWQRRGANCAVCQWLARQRPSGKVRRAREILRRYRPYRRAAFPWRGCCACRGSARGRNRGDPQPRQLQSAGNAEGVTPDSRCAPQGTLGTGVALPALSSAAGERNRAKPLEQLGGFVKGQKSQGLSLQAVFREVLKAVGYILDSMCRKFELQGFSQGKSIWPIIIQIDNVAEVRKH